MKKKNIIFGVSLFLLAQFVFAEKVAVLNLQAAIFNTASAQKTIGELQARSDYAQWIAQEEAVLADLRKLNEEAEKNNMTWSAEQKAANRKKMASLQSDREFNMKKIQTENNAVRVAVQKELLPKAELAVKQVVESEGVEVVLDQQAVLWVMPKIDITQKVTAAMDKQKNRKLSVSQKTFTLSELAEVLKAESVGDPHYSVCSIASIEKATAQDLTFVASAKYEKYLAETRAGIVVLTASASTGFSGNKLLVGDPYQAYARLSKEFDGRARHKPGIHPSAVVAATASIAASASIGAFCAIGENVRIAEGAEICSGCSVGDDVTIGDHCLLHANVTVYSNTKMGANCVIHSGTVLGSDGFGFAPSGGSWTKIHQLGGLIIGDKVEIGANCAIDRGALEDTLIGHNVIIDNLVHIAHNVKIGDGSAIAGCVGIAGSAVIGKNCTIAGAVAINGHIEIADNTHFHGGTIVTKGNRESATFASAPPVMEVSQWRKTSVRYRQLNEWIEKVKALERAGDKEK